MGSAFLNNTPLVATDDLINALGMPTDFTPGVIRKG
jgi:hypothetical protein